MNKIKIILAIGAGSFIGGILRYLLSVIIQTKTNSIFPFATFLINITGCFLIGIVIALSNRGSLTEEWRLFLATGILGGFTTFSAFSYETVSMLRSGESSYAIVYMLLSVLLGLFATYIGIVLID